MRPRRPLHDRGRRARERVHDLDAVELPEPLELGRVDDVLGRAPRGEQPHLGVAAARDAVAQHRHQRDDARAAADEQQRAAGRGIPGEVAADRAAQLELVARPQLVDEVRRDLAVVESLDRERERGILGRRGDRVAALRLIAVLRRQPHVDVLTRAMAGPAGSVEHERS